MKVIREPLTGWRWWQWAIGITRGRFSPMLGSCAMCHWWEGPVEIARDRGWGPAIPPSPFNNVGIWAFSDPLEAKRIIMGNVFGCVELSGTVAVHKDGYRGEIAVVRSLLVLNNVAPEGYIYKKGTHTYYTSNEIKMLENRYQAEVTVGEARYSPMKLTWEAM